MEFCEIMLLYSEMQIYYPSLIAASAIYLGRTIKTGIADIEWSQTDITNMKHHKEEIIREWAFRSLVSLQPILAGEIINDGMIWSKRPGTGIPSYRMDEVIGLKAKKNIPQNVLISWDDLE